MLWVGFFMFLGQTYVFFSSCLFSFQFYDFVGSFFPEDIVKRIQKALLLWSAQETELSFAFCEELVKGPRVSHGGLKPLLPQWSN